MVNDSISDFLARIKNGYLGRKKTVVSPCVKTIKKMADLLVSNGYLEKMEITEKKQGKKVLGKEMILYLKYVSKKPAVEEIIRVSKPGKRVYKDSKSLPYVLNGYGMSLISTSKGILTDKEARKSKLGGEIICKIW